MKQIKKYINAKLMVFLPISQLVLNPDNSNLMQTKIKINLLNFILAKST